MQNARLDESQAGIKTARGNTNFQMFKLVLEKAEEPEIRLPTFVGENEGISEKHLLLLH